MYNNGDGNQFGYESQGQTGFDGDHTISNLNDFITTCPETREDKLVKGACSSGKVKISLINTLGKLPEEVWDFELDGHQVEKMLKDRKSRALSIEAIPHYQRVVIA